MLPQLAPGDRWVDLNYFAKYLGITTNALRCRYFRGGNGLPQLHKFGNGSVRVKLSDVLAAIKPKELPA